MVVKIRGTVLELKVVKEIANKNPLGRALTINSKNNRETKLAYEISEEDSLELDSIKK